MRHLLLAAVAAIILALAPQAAQAHHYRSFHHAHHWRISRHHAAYGHRYHAYGHRYALAPPRSESEQGFGFFQPYDGSQSFGGSFAAPLRHVIHGAGRAFHQFDRSITGGRPSGCPHAYCGCGTSLYFFHRIVPDLNLAANWLRFPHVSAQAGTAAVAPSRHHVLAVVANVGGMNFLVHDSNSGRGLTRDHVRNLSGYTFVRPS